MSNLTMIHIKELIKLSFIYSYYYYYVFKDRISYVESYISLTSLSYLKLLTKL